RKQYRQAFNYYDSMKLDDPTIKNKDELEARKKMLGSLASNIDIIERQDSLQRIAAMPEEERKDFVKKLVKQLRKSQGLKDDVTSPASSPFSSSNPQTLFPSAEPRGEWYFYNANYRSRGQNEFKGKWGNRPNIDNWRRATAIAGILAGQNFQGQQGNVITQQGVQGSTPELSFERMYANLPLLEDQLKKSNDSIQAALFALGKIFIQEIEDCQEGTKTYEQLRIRFPKFQPMDEVLFNLYYCYNKHGETSKVATIKKLMSDNYNGSNFTTIVTTGKNPLSTSANIEATKAYEGIYDLFIEGKFEQAIKEKKSADSLYGKNFWTPQLLYIESVYYIKQRNDSVARGILNMLLTQFPNSPMATKASALLDVLSRREQIETELRNLVIDRKQGDTNSNKPVSNIVKNNLPAKDSTKIITAPLAINNNQSKDSLNKKPPEKINTPYTFSASSPHYVVLVLNKVDPVFVNEAKNAFARYNRETYFNKQMSADLADLDADNRFLLISPFKDAAEAISYIEQARPKTATEIVPWLRGGKYYFIILSDNNYDLLKVNKDMDNYKAFLNQHFPGKF
ncbi:MAG: tetratricopeptide repeat protein, partial [Chitinophagaceae bacterium]